MDFRFRVPALGALVLIAGAFASCERQVVTPDFAVVLEEQVTLQRQAAADVAIREITVRGDAILVAEVTENLTDVRLKLEAVEADGEAIKPVEVENSLDGAGVEIATLRVRDGARVSITLSGRQNAVKPGAVHLRVQQFAHDARRDARFAARMAAFEAWSSGTDARHRPDAFRRGGLAELDRAIANLEGPYGDPLLAAEAHLVKASILHFFQIDFHQSAIEARRAAQAFGALNPSAALQVARANLIEARALNELAQNPKSKNPGMAEANVASRRTLAQLIDAASPFGAIERARAIDALGYISQNDAQLDEANQLYERARAMYQSVGYVAGEREMLASMAHIFVERGQFDAGAKAYHALLADIPKISNPYRRVSALANAGRAESFSGRSDQGVASLLEAIAQAREFELRAPEGMASIELGFLYWFRGDYLQAKAFFVQSMRLAREDHNEQGLAVSLQAMGMIARHDGEYEKAVKFHKESIRLAQNPILRMRTMRHLALDYAAQGRNAEAIAELRAALATPLDDPRHQAYSDLKRDLAELLVTVGDGTPASFAEADTLLDETLQMCLNVKDKLGEIGAHRVRAAMHAQQGRYAAARAEFEKTFELTFKYRQSTANAQLRTQTLAHEQPAFRGYFDLMMREVVTRAPAAPRTAPADAEDALRMLELARESHFGMTRAVTLDAATQARMDDLLAQMAARSLEIAAMLKRDLDAAESAKLEELQLDMSRLRAEVDRERTAAADQQAGNSTASVTAARPWRDVGPDTAQISYALGNERAYVWVRDSRGLRVATLSETPEAIERALTELSGFDAQHAPEKIERSLARISAVLLPPGLVAPDSRSLEIVAEGRIASVPFPGLRSPSDPKRRLVETHAVTLITSMLSTNQPPRSRQDRPFKLVALASGSGTLRSAPVANPAPKLQAAVAEISAVADLFEARDPEAKVKLLAGKDGDAETLRGIWSSGADVVHFATHALADLRQPLASLLVLPAQNSNGDPAYLTAGQVQQWRGDAELVFLSACESAIGPPRFAGGMPGLQSAFLRAGARGVIATLWPIEDVMAREFTADFYQRFTRGKSAVQALGETQRAWLTPKAGVDEDEQIRRRITAMAHAYFSI
jgi:CHAT domain-containing protein